jgi:hypothetical protein
MRDAWRGGNRTEFKCPRVLAAAAITISKGGLYLPIPSPAFRKGSHRGLARLFVAVRRRVILMMLRDDQRSNKRVFQLVRIDFRSPPQMLDWGT